ncbi:MAG TPA: GNAT family N-acyltransferase [Bryobacteraceae bacterium]|nr:GNAT family N-acyltransferase [Bryobacteraceae bacterium]
MATRSQGVFDAARSMLERTPIGGAGKLLHEFLFPGEIEREWMNAARSGDDAAMFARFLGNLNVKYEFRAEDLRRLPQKGPVVVVANHPFGLVEGAILGAWIACVRPDFKFLANSLLASVPALHSWLISVDPFGGAAKANWKSLRASLEWLKQGGVLVTFPAGEVASLQWPKMQIADPAWNANVARLIRISGAAALPAYFHGANGAGFQIAGLIHPGLRTALLPRELLNKRGRTIRVSIGRPILAGRLKEDRDATAYLRSRTHVLGAREAKKRWNLLGPAFGAGPAPIAGAVDAAAMRAEVAALAPSQKLLESSDYQVYFAGASEIPNILREIGRLREIAFRGAGEGTGRSLDLDRFDANYQHLWIWKPETSEVVGAYRLAGTDAVDSPRGLYTNTLFRFRSGLLEALHPALELGRSFVRPEYQKSYAPLLVLWKGIGQYVARHPRYRVLFGPVSISRDYTGASRTLIVAYLNARLGSHPLAALVEPRKRFHARRFEGCDAQLLGSLVEKVEELSDVIADIEPDGKGIPVLLRQYLNAGGEVLAFNVDPLFSDVLDGLVVVDLQRMGRTLLERYMGKTGAEAFISYHHR